MTRIHLRPLLWLALCATLATTTAGCTEELTEGNRPCPCSDGWTCCANKCVPEGQFCADPTPPTTPTTPTTPRDTTAPAAPQLTEPSTGLLTRQRTTTVKGTAEANATVSLYLNANCGGSAARTISADDEGRFELTVTVAANARTSLSANAHDEAGNTSSCTALTVDHDDTSPVVGTWEDSAGSPTGSATFLTLRGTTEGAARVSLFAGERCEGTPVAEQAASATGAFSFVAKALANQTSRWSVRATDAAGNEGPCFGEAVSYTHDDVAPAAPTVTSAPPASGTSQELSFSGTAEPGTTVRLWQNATCSGATWGTSVVPSWGSWAFFVSATRNATTQASIRAEDPAHNRSECVSLGGYAHDDLPPATPSQLATSPASPNNVTRAPELTGRTDPDAHVFVLGSECGTGNGQTLGETRAGEDGTFRLALTLPADACTLLVYARDALGNATWASLRYVYDATPPPPPDRLRLAAPSPSAVETRVTVFGTAPLDARVQLFSEEGCQGPVRAEVYSVRGPTASDPTWFQVPLDAAAETTTRYSARTVDGVGNVSGCVAVAGAFEHASDGPGWRAREALSFGPRHLAHDEQGFTFALDYETTSSSSYAPWRVKVARRASAGDGTSWGTPRVLTSGASFGGLPRLAVNARGDAAVVWAEGSGVDPMRLVRFDSRTGVWTEPLALTVLGSPTGEVAVALDAGGDVTACWVSLHSDEIERVWCARVPAVGPVEASETLADVASDTRLEGALTAGGQVLLVWSQDLGGDKRGYHARTLVPGAGWGAVSDPTEGATGTLRLGATRHGTGWVAYSGVTGTSLRRFDPAAGGLQAAELVAPREFEQLSVLLEPEGDTVIGATGRGSTAVWVGHRVPGNAWTSSTVTVPTVFGSYSVKLTTAAPGEAWVFWDDHYGPYSQGFSTNYWRAGIWAQRFRAGTGWGEVRLLEVDPSSYVHLEAADGQPDGLVTLTWRHYNTSGEYPSALRIFR